MYLQACKPFIGLSHGRAAKLNFMRHFIEQTPSNAALASNIKIRSSCFELLTFSDLQKFFSQHVPTKLRSCDI